MIFPILAAIGRNQGVDLAYIPLVVRSKYRVAGIILAFDRVSDWMGRKTSITFG